MAGLADDAELARMLGLTADADGGDLAGLPTPMGVDRRAWLIAVLVIVVAIVVYMMVAITAGNS